jgi:hypothetical protein
MGLANVEPEPTKAAFGVANPFVSAWAQGSVEEGLGGGVVGVAGGVAMGDDGDTDAGSLVCVAGDVHPARMATATRAMRRVRIGLNLFSTAYGLGGYLGKRKTPPFSQ